MALDLTQDDKLVAAVIRLARKRDQLQEDLTAAEGEAAAFATELAASRTARDDLQTRLDSATVSLDKCKATRSWLNDRVAQLEAAWPSGTPMPAAPTPKP